MINLTVGVEGPVLAGKSTVALALKDRMHRKGIGCVTVPCFVEAALTRGLSLPEVMPLDAASQVAAVRFYLIVDQLRRPAASEGVLLLDRTCWTLLAHTASLAAMGLVDALPEVQQSLDLSSLVPEVLIYLDVSHAQQLLRSRTRGELPRPLLDTGFNLQFRLFFQRMQSQPNTFWINADRPITEILDTVENYILKRLAERS